MWAPLSACHLSFAGVIGLSTALKIQEEGGYHVTVLAQHLPEDPKDAYYSSCWAVRAWISVDIVI